MPCAREKEETDAENADIIRLGHEPARTENTIGPELSYVFDLH